MFATLAGGLPHPPPGRLASPTRPRLETEVAAGVALQVELGLEPVSDGDLRTGDPVATTLRGLEGISVGPDGRPSLEEGRLPSSSSPFLVGAWRATAGLTDRAVKQVVAGPYTLSGLVVDPAGATVTGNERERLALAFAEALNPELRALAAAGCPLIQVDEPAAAGIGDSPSEARVFRAAQLRLLEGVEGAHVSLAVTGGNADRAGDATFFDAPYSSFLFDLVDGPDNWRLIARAPTDRGIVCGVVPCGDQPRVEKEVAVWAAHYAASTMGRGLVRVGLATSGSMSTLAWPEARERLELLAMAARIAAEPSMERMARELDPRAFMPGARASRRPGARASRRPGARSSRRR